MFIRLRPIAPARWLACLLCLCLVTGATEAAAERRLALVVGNGAYEKVTPLANPVRDADAVAGALERLDFEVVRATDVDHRGFVEAVRAFSDLLEGADMALFYYAGHGLQVNGTNYLIPVDAEIEQEADLDFTALDADFVLRQMERHAAVKLVLLDACRNNPFNDRLAQNMGATRALGSLGKGLAPMEALGGALIGFATDPGALAFDGAEQHSPFTAALLEHIETPGLEINVMMTRVRADVYRATNRLQRPWVTTSLIGEVYLAPETPAPPPAAAAPAPRIDERQLDLAFWEAVKDSTDAADFAAYLAQFPEGVFAPLARSRLERLEREAALSAVTADPVAAATASAALAPLPEGEPAPQVQAELPAGPAADREIVIASAREAAVPEPPPEAPLVDLDEEEAAALAVPLPRARPRRIEVAAAEAAEAARSRLALNIDTGPPGGRAGGVRTEADCPVCPDMVSLRGGSFVMGSPRGEGGAAERPQTTVTLAPFDIAQRELTVGQFRAFVKATGKAPPKGCFVWTPQGRMRRDANASWEAPGYPVTEQSPAACLSAADAQAYADWVNALSGRTYRLPSEAEFEFAARGGTASAFFWGASADAGGPGACEAVNGAGAEARFRWRNRACDDGIATVAEAGSLPPNAYGLHEMIGNLWEWTADCWAGSHRGAAADGRARTRGACESRVVRGGSWDDPIENLRSAYRVGIPAGRRQGNVGFRLARDPE